MDANLRVGAAYIQFAGECTGNPTLRSRSFGDGNASSEWHSIHTYTVNLTINIQVGLVASPSHPGGDDISDVAMVACMVVGRVPADLIADFNGNGRVDIGDAAKIVYFVVGEIDTL